MWSTINDVEYGKWGGVGEVLGVGGVCGVCGGAINKV